MENKIKMIHEWIDAHQDEMVEDLMELIKIPSVSDKTSDIKPFGQGCIDAMAFALKQGEKHGFATHNFENYVGSMTLDPSRSIDETIGIWGHLDVVPPGDDWHSDPYAPFIANDCIVGRGATDNKDAVIGSIYIMRAIKELGIELNHNITAYFGTSEETGMHDIQYYLEKNYPLPKLSLVPDAGWPGMLGQFGRIEYNLTTDEKVSEYILDAQAGHATNIIPGEAYIVLSKKMGFDTSKVPTEGYTVEETEDTVKITALGKNGHAAFPDDGAVNALYLLTKVIAENGCLNEYDQKIFDFLTAINADYYGSALGITGEDKYGKTISSATMINLVDGKLVVRNDCRFKVSGVFEEHVAAITKNAAEHGMTPEVLSFMNGSAMDADAPEIEIIKAEFNAVDAVTPISSDKELVVSRGGTYAGKLPRAIAVGMTNNVQEWLPPREPGHGGPHQPDEMRHINCLMNGVKLFATILVKMDAAI